MTPDDKRRLAEIRDFVSPADTQTDRVFLLRLLDKAAGERDAAMAALRDLEGDLHTLRVAINSVEGYRDLLVRVDDMQRRVKRELAAHSAATKPADTVEKAQE